MPDRKRYCELGGMFCRHAYTMNGEPSCRLIGASLRGKEECIKVVHQREKQRVALWFEENGWQKRILFMRGVSYQKDDNELIIDSRSVIFNGKRLNTEDEIKNTLTLLLPNWLIEMLIERKKESGF